MQPNDLAKWLRFYDDQRLSQPRAHPFGYGVFGGGGGVDETGPDRLSWATDMAGGNNAAPSFFGSQPMNQLAAYTQPREFTETMPARKPMVDPMRMPAQNYLMKLLGGR